jgi:xylan 1,4-beta-xylosidase
MEMMTNPILRGFNPDPSIVRVSSDYYIATSTFEWFPGVQIHHSRDLVHWRLLTRPLTRMSQLDLTGSISSGGVWAPNLSYHDGTFYLIYTNVKSKRGRYRDMHNYLVTAPDITGPWSEPIYLNSSGFDPSLFHDDNGRKWLLNMEHDHRKGHNRFGGIVLQEYSVKEQGLVGPITKITTGSGEGYTEGPNLYKHNGRYYLILAEGGTGYGHIVTMARANTIKGPYEYDPANPVLTSRHDPNWPLQKAGHASIVETQNGDWYMVHLCGRPLPGVKRCTLGRETAIQKCEWTDDGWLKVETDNKRPKITVAAPDLPLHPFDSEPIRDDFETPELNIHFQTLRVPVDDSWLSLTARPGWLRLTGRESPTSKFFQSLVARRFQAFEFDAATCVEFKPKTYQQMAGLICLYDVENHYYLRVSYDEARGKVLGIVTCDNGEYDEPLDEDVEINGWSRVHMKAHVDHAELQFSYSADGEKWMPIGPVLDASKLSDEYSREGTFTGAFVGICCHDMSGCRQPADFEYFEYRERM